MDGRGINNEENKTDVAEKVKEELDFLAIQELDDSIKKLAIRKMECDRRMNAIVEELQQRHQRGKEKLKETEGSPAEPGNSSGSGEAEGAAGGLAQGKGN